MTVVLLSGGVDSAVCLGLEMQSERQVHALSVNYGQLHSRELDAAAAVAAHYRVRHTVVEVKGLPISSALTGVGAVPLGHAEQPDATYVPARNTMLLALAASMAETVGSQRVVIGCNADDAAGYPDCRRTYIEAMRDVLTAGTVNHVWVAAPLLAMSKIEIVSVAKEHNVPLDLTWSCYRGGALPCGCCGACESRNGALA